MPGRVSFEEIEQARASIPRTLMLIGESKSASWAWRVEWPCQAMRDRGYISDWVNQTQVAGALFALEAGRYNVILTPRAHWPDQATANEWIKSVHGYGLAWAYEIDDDGWSAEIVGRQARLFEEEWLKGEYQLEVERQERIELINRADGVIVSTQALADIASQYTKTPIWVVPNLVHADWFMGRLDTAKRMIPPLTVGWSGGVRDESDLDVVAEAWGRVAKRHPEVKFVVHGVTPKNLASAIPGDQLVLLAWTSFPDFPRSLMNIDIACCAVKGGIEFNLAKSPIKWMEATLAGAASVVSKPVYGDVVTDGIDGRVCETVDDWESALCDLIEKEDYRRQLVDSAKQTVWKNHSLNKNWSVWIESLAGVLRDGQRLPTGLAHAISV